MPITQFKIIGNVFGNWIFCFNSNYPSLGVGDCDEEVGTKGSRSIRKCAGVREKRSTVARRKYLAPADKRGLQLNGIIGYNGKYANKNVIWSPEREFFAFTCGNLFMVGLILNSCVNVFVK